MVRIKTYREAKKYEIDILLSSQKVKEEHKKIIFKKTVAPLFLSVMLLTIALVIGFMNADTKGKFIVIIINFIFLIFLIYFFIYYLNIYLRARGLELSREKVFLPTFPYYRDITNYEITWEEIECIYTNPHREFITIILKDNSKIDIFKEDIEDINQAINIFKKYAKIKHSDYSILEDSKC